ncbi:diaminopimelate decarboxylase [Fluviispira multicolorata]|nr:diaminopimelate decarboxylase [Fluviispira multicolorata]
MGLIFIQLKKGKTMRPFFDLAKLTERKIGHGFLIDNVPLSKILECNHSPVYVTSLNAVAERVNIYQTTLKKYFKNNSIFYAMKANFSNPILKQVQETTAGVDIVSIGEWRAALKAGFSPQKICFAGVGKKEEEWREAIEGGLGYLNVEHLDELKDILNYISDNINKLKFIPVISLRLNPCLEVKTHPHLKTGALDSKFGILFEHFEEWVINIKQVFPNSQAFQEWISPLKGIHVHVGSQLMENKIFSLIIEKILECASFMFENNIKPYHIDLGGGLGVPYEGVSLDGTDISVHVEFFCSTLINLAKKYKKLHILWGNQCENLFVCFEPGRSIVASSTVFLTKVLYTKHNSNDHNFCFVDGAMNDFPRPSIYNAKHQCEVVNFENSEFLKQNSLRKKIHWQIVGPVCESGDFLSKDALLPKLFKNDVLAFFEAGAYCRSMASHYNLRKLPAEIFIKNGKIIEIIEN